MYMYKTQHITNISNTDTLQAPTINTLSALNSDMNIHLNTQWNHKHITMGNHTLAWQHFFIHI